MKDKYEISLWEYNGSEESKLFIIGSDTMTSPNRALEPKLVENVNGTSTFTFKMYYTYKDPDNNYESTKNPFIKYLVNERLVKVLWKGQWRDFIIKNCQEDSNGKSITYTCKDLFINELSKNGFQIEFDTELMNNQGSADELVRETLKGTDWSLNDDYDII